MWDGSNIMGADLRGLALCLCNEFLGQGEMCCGYRGWSLQVHLARILNAQEGQMSAFPFAPATYTAL